MPELLGSLDGTKGIFAVRSAVVVFRNGCSAVTEKEVVWGATSGPCAVAVGLAGDFG